MKNRDEKYMDACERNITLHERIKADQNIHPNTDKYKGKSMKEAKHALGVKETDSHYDTRIQKLIK